LGKFLARLRIGFKAATACGMHNHTTLPSSDALESLGERLEDLEKRLAERIVALEAQQLGELVA